MLSAAEGAIQYVPQGPGIGKKFEVEKQPLTPELKAKGISEEDYAAICELLRTAFGLTGTDGSFSKAITKANEEYFEKVGCVACYAEYYKGCKVLSPCASPNPSPSTDPNPSRNVKGHGRRPNPSPSPHPNPEP